MSWRLLRKRTACEAFEEEVARAREAIRELLASGAEMTPHELHEEVCRRAGVSDGAASAALFGLSAHRITRLDYGERPRVRLVR